MNKYRDFDNYLKEYPDEDGYFGKYGGNYLDNPAPVYSNANGLDYPSVGPEHVNLHDMGRINYVTVGDDDAIEALFLLSRYEGIIPAIKSSHALAYAIRVAREIGKPESIVVNLSGRGDKDIDFVVKNYGYGENYLKK